jgi:hypothetical protein
MEFSAAGADCVRKSGTASSDRTGEDILGFSGLVVAGSGKILRISGWRSSFATRPVGPLRETNAATFAPDVY